MSKGPQIALSIFAVIAIPVLVGQATEPAPTAKKAALTIQLGSSEIRSSDRAEVHIQAAGKPPRGTTLLTSADGLKLVRARSRTSKKKIEECLQRPVHHADPTLAGDDWCIALGGIDAGSAVSGQLNGKGTELTLAVNRRAEFWSSPLLVIVIGLILGGLSIPMARFARLSVRKARLDNLLEKNENADEGKKIVDLKTWVTEQREGTGAMAKRNDDQLLPVVADLVSRAPRIAAEARALLRRAFASSTLPRAQKAVKAADEELKRKDLKISDFVKADGTPAIHPARQLAEVLTKLGIEAARLRKLEEAIDALEKPAKPREVLGLARARFDTTADLEDLTELLGLIDKVEQAIAVAQPDRAADERVAALAFAGPVELAAALAMPHETAPATHPVQGEAKTEKWIGRLIVPGALTLLVFLFTAAVAVLTIKVAAYDPKPAFGSDTDYLALLVAAIGSGATGTLLGIISVWDPLSPAEEA